MTAEELRSRLHYDPETGVFTWKEIPATSRETRRWNSRYAGRKAGCLNRGYVRVHFKSRAFSGHRLAWLYMTGAWPFPSIDHINGVTDDNRFCNLRIATHAQNSMNRKTRHDNILGVKGVRRVASGNYQARVMVNGKAINLGMFSNAGEAASAYQRAAEEFRGEFANVR